MKVDAITRTNFKGLFVVKQKKMAVIGEWNIIRTAGKIRWHQNSILIFMLQNFL